MQRTPQPNTNPKRRLDDEFEDGENNGSTSKQDGTLSTSKRQNPNELTGRSFNKFGNLSDSTLSMCVNYYVSK